MTINNEASNLEDSNFIAPEKQLSVYFLGTAYSL